MASKEEKAEAIKDLAINGLFDDIIHKFGEKSLAKAKEYALTKLRILKEKLSTGEDAANIKIATPFMIFAATVDEPMKIDKVSQSFYVVSNFTQYQEGTKEEQEILTEPQDEIPPPCLELTPLTEPQNEIPPPCLELTKSTSLSEAPAIESNSTEEGVSSVTIPLGEDVDMDAPEEERLPFSPQEDAVEDTLEEKQLSSSLERDMEINAREEIEVPVVAQSAKKGGFQMPAAPPKKSGFQVPVAPVQGSSSVTKRPISTKPDESSSAKTGVAKSKKSSTSESKKGKEKPISKKAKKEMFKNAPKNPMNSYMLFGETTRKEVLIEDPNMKVTEVMKEVGIRWRLLEAEEKSTFEERAKEAKSRCIMERADYFLNFPEEAAEWESSSKKTKTSSKDKNHDRMKQSVKGRGKKAASVSDGEDSDDEDDLLALPPDVRRQKIRKVAKETNPPKEAGDDEDEFQDDFEDDEDEEAEAQFTQSTPNPHRGSRPAVVSTSHSYGEKSSARKVPQSKGFKSNLKGKSSSSTSSSSLKVKIQSDDAQIIPYIDPIAAAITTAKTVSSLKGIKQTDLPFGEDLLKTKAVPFERCSFPTDFEPLIGGKVTLIPESYRKFITELEPNLLTPEDVELIQDACALQAGLVDCVITASRPATPEQQSNQKKLITAQILTFKVRSASGEGFDVYNMLYVPFSSPLLITDIFLLDRAEVRRIFAANSGVGGIFVEGSIYHIRQDMKSNPYNSISVVDQQQEKGTLSWFYTSDQGQTLCSPWDLQLSKFVQKAESVPLPRTLAIGHVTAEAVLNYLKVFDFTAVFCYRLTDNAEYCKMFPRKHDRLDLHVISARCKDGNYAGKDGVNIFFEDLEAMCLNGKKFNDANKDFQPWTFVDMTEKTIADLQLFLGRNLESSSFTLEESGDANYIADRRQGNGGLMADLDEAEEDQEDERDGGEEIGGDQEDSAAAPVGTSSSKRGRPKFSSVEDTVATSSKRQGRPRSSQDADDAVCTSEQDERCTQPMSQKEQEFEMEVSQV